MRLAAYPGYRASGVEWLGEVPEHWGVKRLKWSVAGCINGVWGDEPDGVDDVVCVRVADFDRDRFSVTTDSLTIRSVEPKQRQSRKLRKGDLLIEKSGGGDKQLVGCVVYFDHEFEAVCSNFVARMPVDPELPGRYWSYVHAALYAGRLNYPAIKQTTGIQNLDAGEYLNTLAAYPPVDEQENIADFLDWKTAQIDALIAKKQELIAKLKEKRLAVITQAVTKGLDPKTPLRDSGVPWLGKVPAHWAVMELRRRWIIQDCKHKTVSFVTDGVPLASIKEVHDFEVNLEDANQTTYEEYLELIEGGREPMLGDIIYSRNASVGDAAIVSTTARFSMGQDVCLLRSPDAYPRFVAYLLRSQPLREQAEAVMIGSTFRRINVSQIKSLWVTVPPVDEQREISEALDRKTERIDSMIEKAELAVSLLTEYRSALITAATTGKIDLRGWQAEKEAA